MYIIVAASKTNCKMMDMTIIARCDTVNKARQLIDDYYDSFCGFIIIDLTTGKEIDW